MEKLQQLIEDIRNGKIEFCENTYTRSLLEMERDARDIEQFVRNLKNTIHRTAKNIKVLKDSTDGYEITLKLFIGRT